MTRPRRLFGAGLLFFMVGIVLPNPALMGFALVLLVAALLQRKREPDSADGNDGGA
jgi:hypothetical protein